MSHDQIGKTTRRDFLGTATAATALTLGTSPGAEAQTAPIKSDEVQVAQLTTGQSVQPTATGTPDWTKPAAMAIPKEGYFKLEQGRYGPVFPRTPANYGFTIIAKVKPGREQAIREYGKTIEKAVAENPLVLLRRSSFITCDGFSSTSAAKRTSCIRGFSTLTLTSTPKMPLRFSCRLGAHHHVRESGRLPDGLENKRAGVRKVRARPSLSKLSGIRRISVCHADEVKKALRVKSALSTMLDQMQ